MQDSYIVVSLSKKTLTLTHSTEQHVFPIAVGKPDTPTPKGTWLIQNKKILPNSGVFGTHWLGLSKPGYGIHGTDRPDLIGQQVSGGCIRMHNTHIQYVFQRVSIGTAVTITD